MGDRDNEADKEIAYDADFLQSSGIQGRPSGTGVRQLYEDFAGRRVFADSRINPKPVVFKAGHLTTTGMWGAPSFLLANTIQTFKRRKQMETKRKMEKPSVLDGSIHEVVNHVHKEMVASCDYCGKPMTRSEVNDFGTLCEDCYMKEYYGEG